MDETPQIPPQPLRAIILFDGTNWFHAFREYLQNREAAGVRDVKDVKVDYHVLSDWIIWRVRQALNLPDEAAVTSETWYFTAVPEEPVSFRDGLLRFLNSIEHNGIRVERLHTRQRMVTCAHCGKQQIRFEEEEVDVAIASQLVLQAALRQVDVAVLVSGDGDFVPAVVIAQACGVQVFIAGLMESSQTPSLRLRNAATGFIDVTDGLPVCTNGADTPHPDES